MSDNLLSSIAEKLKTFVPSISLDCVVFGYQNKGLHILLLKYKNTNSWALPGGFLPADADMETVITDILCARTGLKEIFLTQYHTFSATNRGWLSTEKDKQTFKKISTNWSPSYKSQFEEWFNQRFISTAFMALIDASKAHPTPDELSDLCLWVPIDDLPPLVLDHGKMIAEALKHLRMKINFLPIGRSLLPSRFTLSDLQCIYEAILRKKMDRGNFHRKIMKLGILNRHEKLMTGAQNKAPYLYTLNDEVYDRLIEEGIGLS